MQRRDLLTILLGIPSLYGISKSIQYLHKNIPVEIKYLGMADGHSIRDKITKNSTIIQEYDTDITIIGSGIAALTSCWKLLQLNYKGKITLITGSELFGNSADTSINGNFFPTGAHYLPLQTEESVHSREILKFFNIIEKNEYSPKPKYRDKDLVYSPMERVLINNTWNEGLFHSNKIANNFFSFISTLKNKKGADGKKLFTIPLSLRSKDITDLDNISFYDWLIKNNYDDSELLQYLNYCCKDDYGVPIEQTSAWAGIHYFAGRTGKCSNLDTETILTWENGNAFLAKEIFNYIKDKINIIYGTAYKVTNTNNEFEILSISNSGSQQVNSKKLIIATPFHIINHLFQKEILPKSIIPDHSVWIVSNFLFKELPIETKKGIGLSYDNIIANSPHLGFVFSHNQKLDISRENKVITTYTCLPQKIMNESRKNILKMNKSELLEIATNDLVTAYGESIFDLIEKSQINIRGHAMPYPSVGFLERNNEIQLHMKKLEKDNIYLAHSDISGISVFEEASWWGIKSAEKILSSY